MAPALRALLRVPITRVPSPPLLTEAWSLRDNVSQRDALYIVLAHKLDALLLTADARLAGAGGLGIRLTVVGV